VVGAQYRWTGLYAPRIMTPAFWSLIQGEFVLLETYRTRTELKVGRMVDGELILALSDNPKAQSTHILLDLRLDLHLCLNSLRLRCNDTRTDRVEQPHVRSQAMAHHVADVGISRSQCNPKRIW